MFKTLRAAAFALAAAALPAAFCAAPAAAAVQINIFEDGSDVRAEYSGSLDVIGLFATFTQDEGHLIIPQSGMFFALPQPLLLSYAMIEPLPRYGLRTIIRATSFGGDFSLGFRADRFVVPIGYRGEDFSGFMVFAGQSIASMQLIPGVYNASLAKPGDLTLTVFEPVAAAPEADVPLPAAAPLLLAGIGGIAALRRRLG